MSLLGKAMRLLDSDADGYLSAFHPAMTMKREVDSEVNFLVVSQGAK